MILPPNSSLQAAKSPGSVGLLQWDVLVAKMALLAALVVQELFGLDSIAVPLFTNSGTAAATPLGLMRNFQWTINQ